MATAATAVHTLNRGEDVIAYTRRFTAGYLTPESLAVIAADQETRLTPVLVRCNGGRFTAPAQDVKHFLDIIERDAREHPRMVGIDWIRDVSLAAR